MIYPVDSAIYLFNNRGQEVCTVPIFIWRARYFDHLSSKDNYGLAASSAKRGPGNFLQISHGVTRINKIYNNFTSSMSNVSSIVFLNKFFFSEPSWRSQSFILNSALKRLDVAFGCFQYLVPQYDILSVFWMTNYRIKGINRIPFFTAYRHILKTLMAWNGILKNQVS